MRKRVSGVGLAAAMIAIAGCGGTPKHTNTLIFGTNTKFAFDVGTDAAGLTSVTLGYKRQEAVWMPLLANKGKGADSEPATDCVADGCLFQGVAGGRSSGDNSSGSASSGTSAAVIKAAVAPSAANNWGERDTYSVLASFGAQFNGDGRAGNGAMAGGGIAQYFATGLAARELARSGGAQLVSVQPEGSVKQQARHALAKETTDLERVLGYVNNGGTVDKDRLTTLAKDSGADSAWVEAYSGGPVSKLRDELMGPSRSLIGTLAAQIKEQ